MTLPRGSSTGSLLLLLTGQQGQQDSKHAADGRRLSAFQKYYRSQPSLQLHEHPADHGLEVRFTRMDEPMHLHEQSSSEGPDALGIIIDPHGEHDAPAGPAATAATPAIPIGSLPPAPHCESIDDLPDDVLRTILSCLDSNHRHVVSSTCERLLTIAQHSFRAVSLALPAPPVTAAAAAATAPASWRQHLASLPARRFDTIRRLELAMPEVTDKRQARCVEDPCHPLNAWVAAYLTTGGAGAALESLRIRALPAAESSTGSGAAHATRSSSVGRSHFNTYDRDEGPAVPGSGGQLAASQQLPPKERGALVSGRALQLLAAHCPSLRRLSVPLLAAGALAALPALASQLHSFSCSVQDSLVIDAVLQLRGLTSLRVALHSNLLSCSLHQQQVQELAKISGLRSLTLCGLLLPEACWRHLSQLTALTELRVSFPFPAEHLQHVTQLRLLQFPTSTTPGSLHHLTALQHLHELRTRQAVCEAGLLALAHLPHLHTLHLDSVRLEPPPPLPPPAPPTVALPPPATPAGPPPSSQGVAAAAPLGTAIHLEQQPAGNGNAAAAGSTMGSPAAGAAVDPSKAAQHSTPAVPAHPAAHIAAHYAGLQVHSVTCLVLTGVHVYLGELGALFPNLTSLAVAAVELPNRLPPAAAPLPYLRALAWPVSAQTAHVVPQLLAAAPALTSLTLTGISSSSALEAAFIPANNQLARAGGLAIAADPAAPAAPGGVLRCRLEHLALVVAPGAGHAGPRARALRSSLAAVLSTPVCSSLTSVTLQDTPGPGGSSTGPVRSKDCATFLQELMPGLASTDDETEAEDQPEEEHEEGAGREHVASRAASLLTPTMSVEAGRESMDGGVSGRASLSGHGWAVPGAGTRRVSADFWGHTGQGMRPAAASPLQVGSWCSSLSPDMLLPGRRHGHPRARFNHCSSPGSGAGQGVHAAGVDAAALAASGKVVDHHLLQVVLASVPGLRSLRVVGAGALTCHGLHAAVKGASLHLELLMLHSCPRVKQSSAEGLGAELCRPWLRVQWEVGP